MIVWLNHWQGKAACDIKGTAFLTITMHFWASLVMESTRNEELGKSCQSKLLLQFNMLVFKAECGEILFLVPTLEVVSLRTQLAILELSTPASSLVFRHYKEDSSTNLAHNR